MTINNILNNKANSKDVSSAKQNAEENAEQTRTNIFGTGRRLHKQLMSDSGMERAQAMAEIIRMIFSY